ncbi:MAG TPA: DUF397 domain-containing protein [Pseudonocardiaceae bacterium]
MTGNTMRWRKSSHSGGTQNACVELRGDLAAVRDSKNQAGPVLRADITALIRALKADQIG